MPWPFLYRSGDVLSEAELCAARLDGDLVEVGEAFMPADAVETRELRAGSLRGWLPPAVALTRVSAAWVHGAVPDPPVRHSVQRLSPTRIPHVIDVRLTYRDRVVPEADVMRISGVAVTSPERTLADLVRDLHGGEPVEPLIEAMIAWRPHLCVGAAEQLARGRLHHKRAALAYLRRRQDEVTR
ncbi:SAM-dependent methyltransferase [Microbacterium sp.]|uniref:SAM-dependent methyltransferase n=1 Tax=Microbacterium sp. TaxID=51671 RepID=UPI0039E61236